MIRFRILTCFLFVLTILARNQAFSQTKYLPLQENKFVKLYGKLTSFRPADYDSISFYAEKFEKEFTKFIKSNPNTLSYPFKEFIDSNYCDIRTSADGKFRIYSWDTWTGGTMHFFKQIYQWKTNDKVFTEVEPRNADDAGCFCSKIFTVNISDKPYYLAVTNAILSTKDAMQSISAYTIEGNKLVDTARLFKAKTKKLNNINVEFDFFSVVDRPERPLELITYDSTKQLIYIPVVGEKGQVTNKNILYQLKGRYFEFIGIETRGR